jgi:antitoxin (DNA-binding transcriptional repressor) of toxin-antitoxin stability system
MTMLIVNIYEVKAKLSEYLDAVGRGERVLICKRNTPVAELRAIDSKRTEPRPIGGGPYRFPVPAAFFTPMPDEWLAELESGPVFPPAGGPAKPSRAAERSPTYVTRRPRKRRS